MLSNMLKQVIQNMLYLVAALGVWSAVAIVDNMAQFDDLMHTPLPARPHESCVYPQ